MKYNMTNEEAIAELKWIRHHGMKYPSDIPGTERLIEALEAAISALKSIDKIKAERDAAVADLKESDCCHYCKYHEKAPEEMPCKICDLDDTDNKWEWRGAQNENR